MINELETEWEEIPGLGNHHKTLRRKMPFPLRFLYCATLVLSLEWRLSYTDLSQGSLDEKGLGLYPGTIQCWKGTWQIQHSPENSLQVRILRESFIILIITIPLPHILLLITTISIENLICNKTPDKSLYISWASNQLYLNIKGQSSQNKWRSGTWCTQLKSESTL